MTNLPTIDDPRLNTPQCHDLTPVETVHENPWFAVRRRGTYYSVEPTQRQVTILPLVEERAVVMIRARRPLIADVTLELPAGGIHESETPAEAAARELAEETGVRVEDLRRFRPLPPLCITPRRPCLPHIYQVDITQEEFRLRAPHDREVEEVLCLSFDDVFREITRGGIYASLPIAIITRHVLARNGPLQVAP